MFGLQDQAIVRSMDELMYSGVQLKMLIDKNYWNLVSFLQHWKSINCTMVFSLKCLLIKITEILFLAYNIESLLTTQWCSA